MLFAQDMGIIALSLFIAFMLAQTDILGKILTSTKELEMIGSFIAGIFFTSIFTVAPAVVTLGEIAHADSPLFTAILGGAGAVIGDLIIFRFVKDRLSEHITDLIHHKKSGRRLQSFLKMKYFHWLAFVLAGAIIASPFPDELGIGLLGFSKMRLRYFIPFAFISNAAGIYLIGLAAKAF